MMRPMATSSDIRAAEQALVDACAAGQPAAHRELVLRYERALRQAIGFLSGARGGRVAAADVDDAVQKTFLAIFNDDSAVLRRWAGRSSLRTYLCRIAERVAIRHFQRLLTRRGRFRLDLDAPARSGTRVELVEDDQAAVPELLIADEERQRLRTAIVNRLSEKGQQYYDYLFVQELSVPEIARREGTNSNNVYQWKNRISRVARSVLEESGYA